MPLTAAKDSIHQRGLSLSQFFVPCVSKSHNSLLVQVMKPVSLKASKVPDARPSCHIFPQCHRQEPIRVESKCQNGLNGTQAVLPLFDPGV